MDADATDFSPSALPTGDAELWQRRLTPGVVRDGMEPMLKERWPLILFIITIAVSAPFWHELLPDEHYEQHIPPIDGRSPQAIFVFDTDHAKSEGEAAPWRIPAGPLLLGAEQWVGQSSQDVGCKMEKGLDQKFGPYGCADQPAKTGDPCVERTAFYAGPRYPRAKAGLVHPAAMDLLLDWEGAKLREMTLRLHPYLNLEEARRLVLFGDGVHVVPPADTAPASTDAPGASPEQADDAPLPFPHAAFATCGRQVCVTVTAFDHIKGVDCGALPK